MYDCWLKFLDGGRAGWGLKARETLAVLKHRLCMLIAIKSPSNKIRMRSSQTLS